MVSEPTPPLLPDENRCLLRNSSTLLLSNPDAAGYLDRRSNISGWYRYWFSLRGSQLLYFERTPSGRRGLLVGTISLFHSKVTVVNTPKRRREFEVTDAAGKIHILRADSDAELHWWVQLFTRARKFIPPAKPIDSAALPLSPAGKKEEVSTVVDGHLSVDHVLCVVHGIGVNEEVLMGNTRLLKESYAEIMAKVFPDVEFRVELLMIHWRNALTGLDVHRQLQAVVPVAPADDEGNPLRQFMVHRIVDYVYYTHHRYRRHILREIARLLNEQVAKFRERRPEFNGQISVMGHSLGAALCYDLLCRKVRDDQVLLEAEGMRLDFDAANLFCVGNPLGTLLALDPTIGLGGDLVGLPFRIYNIFKYHDPIATRLEPRLCLRNAQICPVTVPCWFNMGLRESTTQWLGTFWQGKKNGTEEKGKGTEEAQSPGGRSPKSVGNGWGGEESKSSLRWSGSAASLDEACACGRREEDGVCGSDVRMDFALQVSSTMEEVSTSWSALKAHTEYWGNRDTMLFMVSVMMKTTFGLSDYEGKEEAEVEKRIVDENILRKNSEVGGEEELEVCVQRVVTRVLDEVVAGLEMATEDTPSNTEGKKGESKEGDGGWASYLRGVVWQG